MNDPLNSNDSIPALDALKTKYEKRVRSRFRIGVLLTLNILAIVIVYIYSVFVFEYVDNGRPKELASFSTEVVSLNRNMEAVINAGNSVLRHNAGAENASTVELKNAIDALNENLKSSKAHMSELGKAVYSNQERIQENFLNGKRISLVLCGLIVIYLVKMFAGFYRFNTYLQVYYENVTDTLELMQDGVNTKKFAELYKILSLKDLKIDQEKDFLENIFSTKKQPKEKAPKTPDNQG